MPNLPGGPTSGMGQQWGTAQVDGDDILEVTGWDFEPAQKCGGVVTNATGGFEGQILGAISGKGKVTIIIPDDAADTPGGASFGESISLDLYADYSMNHGFQGINACLESAPVSIELDSDKGIMITYNFKSDGPYTALGAFNILTDFPDDESD